MAVCANISVISSLEVHKTFTGRFPNQSAKNLLMLWSETVLEFKSS